MSTWILAACGLWLIGLGSYFIFLRPALLPEDVLSAANFQLHSDFRWLLLVPALAWLGGFVLYLTKR